jgi:hypothetical protein
MDHTTFKALAAFPDQLEAHYAAVPAEFVNWTPPSWEGIPSERFTALEQVCHVRDIEIDGYHVRIRRILQESNPTLASIDSERLAVERGYAGSDAAQALAAFRAGRAQSITLIRQISPEQLTRTGTFAGYGALSLRSLIHYLCSHDQQHLAGLQWLMGQIDAARVRSRAIS